VVSKLGIIAGSGELPRQMIQACEDQGREVFIISFEGITEEETTHGRLHKCVHIGKVGLAVRTLKEQGIKDVVLAGRVGRPDMSRLAFDYSGIKLLIRLSKLPSQGDDKVFREIISFLESSKFNVIGAEDVLHELLIDEGTLGNISPDKTALKDISIGKKAAKTIGDLDIGQAVIVQQGQILGVEGPEGTDKLVQRCKELHAEGKGGVLVKMKKPHQDTRVDMPSVGVHTIINAYNSGLRGIAVEAGGSLVINREAVIAKADELSMFVEGIKANE
jgi:DUF1009 family protein